MMCFNNWLVLDCFWNSSDNMLRLNMDRRISNHRTKHKLRMMKRWRIGWDVWLNKCSLRWSINSWRARINLRMIGNMRIIRIVRLWQVVILCDVANRVMHILDVRRWWAIRDSLIGRTSWSVVNTRYSRSLHMSCSWSAVSSTICRNLRKSLRCIILSNHSISRAPWARNHISICWWCVYHSVATNQTVSYGSLRSYSRWYW